MLHLALEWIDIPTGRVTLVPSKYNMNNGYVQAPTRFDVENFAIAKYPVTNSQFANFIEAGGYKESQWWTSEGWLECKRKKWTQPRHWTNSRYSGVEQPVIGVSWYEAVAFCRWLSEITLENITLPTEQQWQRAAQGDDERVYPWGDKWDRTRCHNSVGKNLLLFIWGTTSVTYYEDEGTSPFNVVDMAGNAGEWCLTAYDTGSHTVDEKSNRVVRGGNWAGSRKFDFRCDYRTYAVAQNSNYGRGFRIARSL
jgi:formylglycine-generating enzyme required for sulfatase activity